MQAAPNVLRQSKRAGTALPAGQHVSSVPGETACAMERTVSKFGDRGLRGAEGTGAVPSGKQGESTEVAGCASPQAWVHACGNNVWH